MSEISSMLKILVGSKYTSAVMAVITGVAASLSIASIFYLNNDPIVRLKKSELTEMQTSIKLNIKLISELEEKNLAYEKSLNDILKNSANVENIVLNKKVEELDNTIQTLRKSLGGDIERSLSVALLRKDLENSQQRLEEAVETASRSVDRVFDQNKWFIGLMTTMTLGVLGLFLSNLSSRSKKDEDS